jgi:hypothetical protein
MEKASKILTIIFLIGVIYLSWSFFVFNPETHSTDSITVNGVSMSPTYSDGQLVNYLNTKTATIGDVIIFDCLVDKCDYQTIIHRLTAIESNGCMHIEGDNHSFSSDTVDYGCLMPNEIDIVGVVIPDK